MDKKKFEDVMVGTFIFFAFLCFFAFIFIVLAALANWLL